MKKEERKLLAENALVFDSLDEAFEDFVYDFTIEELMEYISDEEKERILKSSPSYVKRNEKYYFSGEFQDILDEDEIDEIIEEIEEEGE